MGKIRKRRTDSTKAEGNAYDKIFRENAEEIFMPLVEERLGIKIKTFKPWKEKMQTTIERDMDFFYEVETVTGERFILHMEFQTENDNEMVYRKGEYHGMALRRKKMPIRHVVVYLGIGTPTMRTTLREEEIYRGFDLINLHSLDTQKLLSSQVPEIVLLAVLSNFPKEDTEIVLRAMALQLKTVSKNKSQLSKFLNQLTIFARLRGADSLTIKIIDEMSFTHNVNIKTDAFYKRGEEKGIEKGIEKGKAEQTLAFVKKLILDTDFSDEKIASLANADLAQVQKMREELNHLARHSL